MVQNIMMQAQLVERQASQFLIRQTLDNEFHMNKVVTAAESLSMNMLMYELRLSDVSEQHKNKSTPNQSLAFDESGMRLRALEVSQNHFSARVGANWQNAQHLKEHFYQYHVPYNNLNLNVPLNPEETLQTPVVQQEQLQMSVVQYRAQNQTRLDAISETTRLLAQELMRKNQTLNYLEESIKQL